MEAVFLAVLMGCSDDLSVCDNVAEREIVASTVEACEMQMYEHPEASRIDYPSALVVCREQTEEPLLVASSD